MNTDPRRFQTQEVFLSQIPAVQLLVNLGWQYLSPLDALAARGGKRANVLLDDVLRAQLKRINSIQYRGAVHPFTEENVHAAIQRLRAVPNDGLQRSNEAVYNLLTLGISLEQTVDGDTKAFSLRYIDWQHPENNVWHVTPEFAVERTRSLETARPDLVLFVNGIPLATIECKAPSETLEQGISQTIRNQTEEFIPALFHHVQLVLATNRNSARYATVGTGAKFWSAWKEELSPMQEAELQSAITKPLPTAVQADLFTLVNTQLSDVSANRVEQVPATYTVLRVPTEQDRLLYGVLRPQRLLDLSFAYTVFDGGQRKVARYQQVFAVQKVLTAIHSRTRDGAREGGIVWHTQGSGKSLTMVMLARQLALDPAINRSGEARIVLVTDRTDLDKQLGNTVAACGFPPHRAKTARELLSLVAERKAQLITTLVHKFGRASGIKKFTDDSSEIFVLVDESHRTQFGSFAAEMRKMFPRACFIGFTGTPLLKDEKKNSFARFGRLLDSYTIEQAVEDGAVVPLLYESRLVRIEQNKEAIDTWFERHTAGLTNEQQADLKYKYSRARMLQGADQVAYMTAFDISAHYVQQWQGTGFKAQLVAKDKLTAIKYHRALEDIGSVSSAVVISAPDAREGFEEVDAPPADEVKQYWDRMMKRHGNEENFLKSTIDQFNGAEAPEILIVVDKLLTGFDAPRNTVLYLTRELRDHTLLQAIARVNRLFEDQREGKTRSKDFGYIIDYAGVLGELDKALDTYEALAEFDAADIRKALIAAKDEVAKLPECHAHVWELFRDVRDRTDEDAFERALADDVVREDFYDRLAIYAKTLALALGNEQFLKSTPDALLAQYKGDLRRFVRLKAAVRLRYSESVDFRRDYEPRIQKLLNTQIFANEVLTLHEPVNIFDAGAFAKVVEEQGYKSKSAQADTMAHATKRAITEQLERDPAFYEKFSKLIQQAIDDYQAKRIGELEYLKRVSEIHTQVMQHGQTDAPFALRGNDDAVAIWGLLKPFVLLPGVDEQRADTLSAELALGATSVFSRFNKVAYWDDLQAQRQTEQALDEFLHEAILERTGAAPVAEAMDAMLESLMRLARNRSMNR
jgi:type I restriction enzyme, R subunit